METKIIRSGMPFVIAGGAVFVYALIFGIGSIPSYVVAAVLGVAGFVAGRAMFPDQVIEIEAAPKSGNAEVDALITEARGQIEDIHAANEAIADPKLSAQIEDIIAAHLPSLLSADDQETAGCAGRT